MNLFKKILLTLVSIFTLSFLLFFTFFEDNYSDTFISYEQKTSTGEFKIENIDGKYLVTQIEKNENYDGLKKYSITQVSNIYYKEGKITINKLNNETQISLEEGVYFFDINEINEQYSIVYQGYKVKNEGPGAFIISTNDISREKYRSIFSLSSKLTVDLLHKDRNTYLTNLEIFPSMYFRMGLKYNSAGRNKGDLGKILKASSNKFRVLSDSIYINTKEYKGLNKDLKELVFHNNDLYNSFINEVFSYRNQELREKENEYRKLTKNNFYAFPGEKYILEYYNYFLNNEKKKYYYKNLILKELIVLLNTKKTNEKEVDYIIAKMKELQALDLTEYDNMIGYIGYYYNNILYSQKNNPEIIRNISILRDKIINQEFKQELPSLMILRSIYEKYYSNNTKDFYKNLNIFVTEYEKEMNLTIYDENLQVQNYFLFYLKGLFTGDFSKVKDHNQIVLLFQKYVGINNIFVQQGTNNIKITALFDNAELLQSFTQIIKINFFENDRRENLLILLKPAKITSKNYKILKENIQDLINFYTDNKVLIINASEQKFTDLVEDYNTYILELSEYFQALNDYNKYVLNSTKIDLDIPQEIDKNLLTIEKAQKYLKQFTGAYSLKTIIIPRNYSYCIAPNKENISDNKSFCYEIKNFYIKGFTFNFILIPSAGNKITFLTYNDNDNNFYTVNENFIMDTIQKGYRRFYENAPIAKRDKYDFSKFFINKFIRNPNEVIVDNTEDDKKLLFEKPNLGEENITQKNLKGTLLKDNSPLAKIRNIIPVSYQYLEIFRENKQLVGKIFPITFKISLEDKNNKEVYTGKFSGKYYFIGNNHIFKESKIYIQEKNLEDIYYFDNKPIIIQGDFPTLDIENILSKILIKIYNSNYIYTQLVSKFTKENISILYIQEQDIIQFTVENRYKFNLGNNGSLNIYNNNTNIFTGRHSQIDTFLQQLP